MSVKTCFLGKHSVFLFEMGIENFVSALLLGFIWFPQNLPLFFLCCSSILNLWFSFAYHLSQSEHGWAEGPADVERCVRTEWEGLL